MQAHGVAERSIDLDGARVRYLEAGNGPPLVLVHGLGHSSTAWARTIDALAARHRVVAPDLPGFGGSLAPTTREYGTPGYFSSVVGCFIDALALAPCDAIGHSGGALAVLLDAAERPGRYRHIVLVDPAGFTRMPRALAFGASSLAGALMRLTRSRAVRRALYATAFYDPKRVDEATVDELVARDATPGAGSPVVTSFARFYEYCRRADAAGARTEPLGVPALVVWGAEDRLFHIRGAEAVRRVLPHARVEALERCGHCPHIECPDRFVTLVQEFLAEQ